MNLSITFCFLLFASTGLAQQRQPEKTVDPVSGVDNMPVLTDTGNPLNMPTRKGQGTAADMPTWTGTPAIRYEDAVSQQLKALDGLKHSKGFQPDSTRLANPPLPQYPRKNRRR